MNGAEILGAVKSKPEKTSTAVARPVPDEAANEAARKLAEIDEELAHSLAALNGAPDAIVAATVLAYRFGTRAVLNGLGLLEDGEDKSGRLRISERGRQVIAACAKSFPQVDTDVDTALQGAREVLVHSEETAGVEAK